MEDTSDRDVTSSAVIVAARRTLALCEGEASERVRAYRARRPSSPCPSALRRPELVVSDGHHAVACFLDGAPFIVHSSLEDLLAMHGMMRDELALVG